jgi:subtilisin family serine protease
VVRSGDHISLEPIDLAHLDAVRCCLGSPVAGWGAGITVGVIDSGISPHPDLTIVGGYNSTGEDVNDFSDNGLYHGMHVAGIIAADGAPPHGIRGVAPRVTLRSYRVFRTREERTWAFYVVKALEQAVCDGCDLINISLTTRDENSALRNAIQSALNAGCLVVAAVGNDGRSAVAFPARAPGVLGVSALGRNGTFPMSSTETTHVGSPIDSHDLDFVAAFSNVGREVQLIGPGVGILSTVPGGYAVMSGTSMSAPAVTGLAARLLSLPHNQGILKILPRDRARSEKMAEILLGSARPLGFGPEFEGQGLPGRE